MCFGGNQNVRTATDRHDTRREQFLVLSAVEAGVRISGAALAVSRLDVGRVTRYDVAYVGRVRCFSVAAVQDDAPF